MTVETILEDERWDAAGLEALAERATDATLTHLGLSPTDWDISLLGCNDTRIAELNADFRDKPQPTNVLSWPAIDRAPKAPGQRPKTPLCAADAPPGELGDIAISYETCVKEAEQAEIPVSAHVTHLLVHGTLHLLGYDHISDADAALMQGLEADILATLGLPDPY